MKSWIYFEGEADLGHTGFMECEKGAICSCVYCAHLSFECFSVFRSSHWLKWVAPVYRQTPCRTRSSCPRCQNKQDLTHLLVEPLVWNCISVFIPGLLWRPLVFGGEAAGTFHMLSGTLQRLVLGPRLGLMPQPAASYTGGEAAWHYLTHLMK